LLREKNNLPVTNMMVQKEINYCNFFHPLMWLETLEQHPGFLPSRITVSSVFRTGGIRKIIAGPGIC
jgi:hypothetical protein